MDHSTMSTDTVTDIPPSEQNDLDASHVAGPASSIHAIDKSSVHRICSGQVVLTLATAVKELVENSLDAGATTIEVRLKEHGSELLEVVDNGCGVDSSNFPGLTLKHHTSKLRDFGDLVNVETFGFRGEALSSLCALSNLVIVTCHKDANVGTRLEYDHNGKITSSTPCARQCGTTVSLGQLFHTLPVRHKEFQRNLKREFSKMVHVLGAYCIMCTGVKITCTNQTSKGKKTTVLKTNGNDTVKENITNIFGPKQFQSLIKFTQLKPSEQVSQEYGIKPREDHVFRIEGYVSSTEHGQGRGATDRQFFFINRRPCDLNKVSRVVNEVYHLYNRHQNPFVVLDISLSKDCVDVNVTPDKRQIFLAEEKLLLATLKTSLIKIFDPISSVYQVNQGQGKMTAVSMKSLFTRTPSVPSGEETLRPTILQRSSSAPQQSPKPLTATLASLKRSFSSAFAKDDLSSSPQGNDTRNGKQKRIDIFVRRNVREIELMGLDDGQCNSQASTSTDSCLPASPQSISSHWSDSTGDNSKLLSPHSIQSDHGERNEHSSHVADSESMGTWLESGISESEDPVCTDTLNTDLKKSTGCSVPEVNFDILSEKVSVDCAEGCGEEVAPVVIKDELILDTDSRETSTPVGMTADSEDQQPIIGGALTELDTAAPIQRNCKTVNFSMDRLRSRLKDKRSKLDVDRDRSRSFRAQIAPTDNQAAEDELKKEIRKDMFEKMEVLGQFNLGFIITKLGTDLFIIDQHATDEKYNFEMLQKHTVLQSQKLIQPQRLELTAVNESVLIDNIDIFRTNGFDFIIDEDAPPTQHVKLTSMPVSRNWTFGKDDIEELIFMLTDSPGVLCRPSRVRMMFASRSCRKSIMVGTALNKTEMKKLVCHMGEIEQPWNCPHGRPTMRHLIDLDCLPD